MARQCLFCSNPVDSAEHLWSDWILKDLRMAPSVRITVGKLPSVWIASPEVKIEVVCRTCNNGWMGNLESANKGALKAMINDDPMWLSKKDQARLCRWALMKAMVIDAVNEERPTFYGDDERLEVKSGTIPVGNLVWLGRLSSKGFHAGGTDIWGDVGEDPIGFRGNVTTIIVGHLAIQLLTGHVPAVFAQTHLNIGCKPGAWDVNLLDIWPTSEPLRWPPSRSFSLEGGHRIGELVNRWKIGRNVG
jgi:hypothetical protein